ncbi:hypothetical protein M446_6896 [Methylobacterium sp. 4-46]|uniref:hypothetical protein n=1 Tax=unclassified Methylobacterium TaxID=2615210 RepID=UPI000165CB43|nr:MULTISPECIES: hypothetical protein [Methylobacterium]ACA21134.1 hypothetical protein M446_6896 [Methylobacterium sp. 4-46]WFT80279.1 hypothetical protein QA634_34805 [Methylobacterium nodulans]
MRLYRQLRERGFSALQTLAIIGASVLLLVAGVSLAVLDTAIASDAGDLLRASIPAGNGS